MAPKRELSKAEEVKIEHLNIGIQIKEGNNMARKRANSCKNKNTAEVKTKPKSMPLMQQEAQYFQELVDVSNRYAGLLKQKAEYEYVVRKLQENRKKIQDGVVKPPVAIVLIPKVMYYQETDKKEIFKFFDDQIKSYQASIKSIEGQLSHRYEEYVESAVRNREFLDQRYSNLRAKHVSVGRKEISDEEELFKADFEKMMKDSKTQKKFIEAKKEAVKKNTQRATKKGK